MLINPKLKAYSKQFEFQKCIFDALREPDFHMNGFVVCCIGVEGSFRFFTFSFFLFLEIETQPIERTFLFLKSVTLTNRMKNVKLLKLTTLLKFKCFCNWDLPNFGNRTSFLLHITIWAEPAYYSVHFNYWH